MTFWWKADKADVHREIFSFVESIEQRQHDRHENNVRYAELYGGTDAFGFSRGLRLNEGRRRSPVTENVIKSVIDTATSMIAKNRPKASVQTDGANWTERRRAVKLDQYLYGVFRDIDLYQKMVDVFRDACVFGTGILRLYKEDTPRGLRVNACRVLSDDIIVDDRELEYADRPLQIHYKRIVEKEVLKELYPDKVDIIEESSTHGEWLPWEWVEPDKALVLMSWRLPVGKKAGRFTVALDTGTLHDDREYKKDYFPFIVYRWRKFLGFYGQGLAEDLCGAQVRINQLNHFIRKAQDLIAVPRVFVPAGSRIQKESLMGNDIAVYPYHGPRPPEFLSPQAVSPEIYQEKERIYQRAFELAGISQLSATSTKPAGIESGVALRELNNIETERFAIQAQGYEEAFLEAAEIILDLSKDIGGSKAQKTVFASENVFEEIDWSDVDMDRDRFMMHIEASSILGRTPAARKETVTEWIRHGFIPDMGTAARLLRNPDLQEEGSLRDAHIDNLQMQIERILEGKTFLPPEPLMDLNLGVEMFTQAYLRAQNQGADETEEGQEALENLREWIVQAQDHLDDAARKKAEAEAQAAPEMAQAELAAPPDVQGGVPGGAPVPLPQ